MTGTISPVLPNPTELGEIVGQVWESFLEGGIVPDFARVDDGEYDGDVVAWVGIGGEWTGHLMVITSPECAQQIAAGMFMMGGGEVSNAEVADALGEIANMVGGSVKGMVGVEATLSLPQVVLDASALVSPDAHKVVCAFATWRGFPLEVSLWERSRKEAELSAEGA